MLREFIDRIADLGVKARGPHILKPPAEPEHVYHLASQDGTWETIRAEPPPRAHRALTLDTVIDCARRRAAQYVVEEVGKSRVAVWYCHQAVELLLDDADRRDRVRLELKPSKQILTLRALEEQRTAYKQPDLIKLLRVTFAGCLGEYASLIEVLRRMKFRVQAYGDSKVEHGKASVGRALEAELTGTGAIPELVTLTVPLFASAFAEWTFPVGCAIEIDAAAESIQLIPFPGQIEAAVRDAEDRIGELLCEALVKTGVAVFHGTP